MHPTTSGRVRRKRCSGGIRIEPKEDNAVLLKTGAGKSIVGVLIAQSLVNEQIGPIVFACSTIDLVEQQRVSATAWVSIPYTTRAHGTFSDDRFETGGAFCITTYQALFTANSTFSKEKSPAGVIFDDAHVAERMIRDAFTLSISKEAFPQLYAGVNRLSNGGLTRFR